MRDWIDKREMRGEVGSHYPVDWSPPPDHKLHSAAKMESQGKDRLVGIEGILFCRCGVPGRYLGG